MAIIVRNGADINIKWMFSISILFHLLFLFTLVSFNIFGKFNSSVRVYMPVSAIHVNIVDGARERPAEMPGVEKIVPGQKLEAGSKKQEVRSQKPEARSKKSEIISKKSEPGDQKVRMGIPEPLIKEKVSTPSHPLSSGERGQLQGDGKKEVVVKQAQEASHSAESKDRPSGLSSEQAAGVRESRLTSGGSMVSGPVVDIPDFKYDYYLGVIRNKIDSRWSQPIAYSRIKQTLVEFTIHRNGKIANARVSESSGDYYFDQTALRAVSLSNPFPPLPRGYKENFLKVRYRFIFGGRG